MEQNTTNKSKESNSLISIYASNCKHYSNGNCALEGGEIVPCFGACGCYRPKEET